MHKIRLTESDVHSIVTEAVKQIMLENESVLEEGWWDTAKSFMGQYGQRANKQMQQTATNVGNRVGQMANAAKNFAQNTANNVQQGYNNMKQDVRNTMQNARQDSSMKEMQNAFNNFKKAVQTYQNNGGQIKRQFKAWVSGIDNMLNGYQQHY